VADATISRLSGHSAVEERTNGHPLVFGYSLVSEALDLPGLLETARRSARVDPRRPQVRDEKTVEGYLG
jgi:hypothetical protein